MLSIFAVAFSPLKNGLVNIWTEIKLRKSLSRERERVQFTHEKKTDDKKQFKLSFSHTHEPTNKQGIKLLDISSVIHDHI